MFKKFAFDHDATQEAYSASNLEESETSGSQVEDCFALILGLNYVEVALLGAEHPQRCRSYYFEANIAMARMLYICSNN